MSDFRSCGLSEPSVRLRPVCISSTNSGGGPSMNPTGERQSVQGDDAAPERDAREASPEQIRDLIAQAVARVILEKGSEAFVVTPDAHGGNGPTVKASLSQGLSMFARGSRTPRGSIPSGREPRGPQPPSPQPPGPQPPSSPQPPGPRPPSAPQPPDEEPPSPCPPDSGGYGGPLTP